MFQIPQRMNYSMSAFQEPRGVMRILQLIFAIAAFASTTNFVITLTMSCEDKVIQHEIEYPFSYTKDICKMEQGNYALTNVASDAQFFVATGVLSLLYCLFVIFIYAAVDELYRTKTEIPLADFMLTTILAIFWLSGSAAWSNGTSTLKGATNPEELAKICTNCTGGITVTSFSRLNISLILGYLNFFLWASDLWFLYKETIWFTGRSGTGGGGMAATGAQPGVGVPSGSMQPNI